MRYPAEIKKFLYSHYFFSGIWQALGVILPAVVLWYQGMTTLGLSIASGALCVSITDYRGTLKLRHHEMLACAFLCAITVLLTGLTNADPLLSLTITATLTFFLSLLVVYGYRASLVGFACLLIMILNVEERLVSHQDALMIAAATLTGGLWYTYFSLLIYWISWHRLEQQALAECIFLTARYLQASAQFYDSRSDLEECHREVITKQISVVEKQDAVRNLILRDLPKLRSGRLDARRRMLFNLFINVVDLHETIISVHTDYILLRETFVDSDLLIFCRDFLDKAARDIDSIGYAIAKNRPSKQSINCKAELRALEYEIELLKRKKVHNTHAEAYAAVVSTFRRMWSTSRTIAKLHTNTRIDQTSYTTETRIDQALSRFISHQNYHPRVLLRNLNFNSPGFRHALRVTLAVVCSLGITLWIDPGNIGTLPHSYWILLTIIVILKPGFSLTKQKNIQRLIGTFIGCSLTFGLLYFVHNPAILFAILFLCMTMSYSLTFFHYTTSVVFTSAYILLLLNFILPSSFMVIGERALDTLIGSLIAVACSYLFPYWEYRVMTPLATETIRANRLYLEACLGYDGQADAFAYRLARKNTHLAFGNFGAAFKRMMLEPKSKQICVAPINHLLIQSHALASHITSIAVLLSKHLGQPDKEVFSEAITLILEKLKQSEERTYLQQNQKEDPIQGTKEKLDQWVITQEEIQNSQAHQDLEAFQEAKIIAHHLKEMLKITDLIAQDVQVIHFPD